MNMVYRNFPTSDKSYLAKPVSIIGTESDNYSVSKCYWKKETDSTEMPYTTESHGHPWLWIKMSIEGWWSSYVLYSQVCWDWESSEISLFKVYLIFVGESTRKSLYRII